ncbi:DNA-packaging protein [Ignatzschineria larvae DSM 13226]|uniref:DNA-packaging protein n=1 Tax=Ignatzschineria larvae DSM 13226 TaxID=1111732 RepID=A0ABZ3BZ60_9GAMM|nr:DNA-packaging protein [Ignatzschineria larvae]
MTKEMGRPSLFSQEMVKKAREYVWLFQQSKTPEEIENNVEVIPSVAGLALYLGVARSTLYEWGKQNKDFSDTLASLQDVQEVSLLNGGLRGRFNPTISKLALANHGYSDKQEIDTKSSDGSMTPKSPITNDQIKEIVRDLKEEI